MPGAVRDDEQQRNDGEQDPNCSDPVARVADSDSDYADEEPDWADQRCGDVVARENYVEKYHEERAEYRSTRCDQFVAGRPEPPVGSGHYDEDVASAMDSNAMGRRWAVPWLAAIRCCTVFGEGGEREFFGGEDAQFCSVVFWRAW